MAEITLAIYAAKSIYDIIHAIQVMIEEVKFNKERCQELAKMVLRVETVLKQHEGNDLCNTEKYYSALKDIENTLVESRELIQNHIEKTNFKRLLKRRDYEFAFENLRRKIHEGISLLNLAITYRIHSMVNELVEHARRPAAAPIQNRPQHQVQQQLMQQQLEHQLSEMSMIQQQVDKLDEGPEDYHPNAPHPGFHQPQPPFNNANNAPLDRDPQEIISECRAMSEKLKAVMQGEEVDDAVLAELVRLNTEMIDLNQRQRESMHVPNATVEPARSFSRPLPTPPVVHSSTSLSPKPAAAKTPVSTVTPHPSAPSQHLPDLFGARPDEKSKKGSRLGSFLSLSKDKDKKKNLQKEKDFASMPNEPLTSNASQTQAQTPPPRVEHPSTQRIPSQPEIQPSYSHHYNAPHTIEEPLPPMRIQAPPQSLKLAAPGAQHQSLPSITKQSHPSALQHQGSIPTISSPTNSRPSLSVNLRNSFQQQPPSGPTEVSFLEAMGSTTVSSGPQQSVQIQSQSSFSQPTNIQPQSSFSPMTNHQPQPSFSNYQPQSSFSSTTNHQSQPQPSFSNTGNHQYQPQQPQHQTSVPFTAIHPEILSTQSQPQPSVQSNPSPSESKWIPPDLNRFPEVGVSFADAPLQIFGTGGVKQTTVQHETSTVSSPSFNSPKPQQATQQTPRFKSPQELNIEKVQEIYFGGLQLSPEVASKMVELYEIDLINANQPHEVLLQGVTSFITSMQVAFRNADPEDKGVLCSAQELHLALRHAQFNYGNEVTLLLYRKYALQEPTLKYMMTIMDFLNAIADLCLMRNKFHWADEDGDGMIRISFDELVSLAFSQTTSDLL